jgi:glyoxylase-like metal-dependent hydrolase (beta-lactamase superfamily II)
MIHVEQHGPVLAIRMARTFLGRPLWWTAAYFVDGVLIDTGPRCAAQHLVRLLRQRRVEQIIITHGHENQIGGLPELHKQFPEAHIYASVRTLPYLEDPTRLKLQLYRRLLWGVPATFTDVLALDAVDNLIKSSNYTFRVVETPGHTPDHISLFEPTQRWVFSGDTFVFGRDETWAQESDLFGVISSLRTLDSLHPERIFSGAGRVSRTPRPELHEKIGNLVRLAREVARMDAAGLSVPEMVARLFHKEPAANFWTFGHMSATHLVEACRSYNAIFAPLDDQATHDMPDANGPDETVDTSDSSTNLSTDWGDLIR